MKKTWLVLALLASVPVMGAETNKVVTPQQTAKSILDDVYVNGVGVMRKPNITGKGEYGAGFEIGYEVNKNVSIGIQNLSYATPDNWRGSAIDETSGLAHWTLFASEKRDTTLGGLGSVTYGWRNDGWALGAGVELKHTFGKRLSAGISGLIRFWTDQKEDLLLAATAGYSF